MSNRAWTTVIDYLKAIVPPSPVKCDGPNNKGAQPVTSSTVTLPDSGLYVNGIPAEYIRPGLDAHQPAYADGNGNIRTIPDVNTGIHVDSNTDRPVPVVRGEARPDVAPMVVSGVIPLDATVNPMHLTAGQVLQEIDVVFDNGCVQTGGQFRLYNEDGQQLLSIDLKTCEVKLSHGHDTGEIAKHFWKHLSEVGRTQITILTAETHSLRQKYEEALSRVEALEEQIRYLKMLPPSTPEDEDNRFVKVSEEL